MLRQCFCGNQLSQRQKTYCSRICQSIGVALSNKSAEILNRYCDCCGKEYSYHPQWKNERQTRFCSRVCKDTQQKVDYQGHNNPMFGKFQSIETIAKIKSSLKNYWSNDNRIKHSMRLRKIAKLIGYYPGTDVLTRQKVKKTVKKRFGVDHPWSNPKIREKCEETSIKRYGKFTWQLGLLKTRLNRKGIISIEQILLNELLKLGFDVKHRSIHKVDGQRAEYDVYIPKINLLIEVDGDYWHGNPKW